MIKGIGTDIIEIKRIKTVVSKRQRFLERNFTSKERVLFTERNNKVETIAGNFAAKEAVSKALGTGVIFSWQDIEVLRNQHGKPIVYLSGNALEIFKKLKATNIQVSISHNNQHAIANCIIE